MHTGNTNDDDYWYENTNFQIAHPIELVDCQQHLIYWGFYGNKDTISAAGIVIPQFAH